MNSDVIKSKIQDKLSEIQDLEDSIIVLKGISLLNCKTKFQSI